MSVVFWVVTSCRYLWVANNASKKCITFIFSVDDLNVLQKRRLLPTRLQAITSHMTSVDIFTATRITNLRNLLFV
jgi:hypothetical protein